MNTTPQRATLVLEHTSATEDEEEVVGGGKWCVVAYLVHDSGRRDRATLSRCGTREEAAETLRKMWQTLTE